MDGVLNLERLYRLKIMTTPGLDDGLDTVQLCMDLGLIAKEYKCPNCSINMKLKKYRGNYAWLCRSSSHRVARSLRKGSWFAESKLKMIDILIMVEFFVYNRKNEDVMFELKLSSHTVCEWRKYFREVFVDSCINECSMLGGTDKIVEIEVFGKKKYDKGNKLDKKWVFGGVERGSNKCFMKVVDSKDKETLVNIIKTYILPGTTIISDCCKSFDCLKDEGYQHLIANRRICVKDAESSAHTNSIKGTWAAIKRQLPRRVGNDQYESHFAEYLWRRCHSDCSDLMKAFIECVVKLYPPKSED